MRIILNPDPEFVKEARRQLELNNFYCPCAFYHNPETRCMCKDMRDKIAIGKPCQCNCGLYWLVDDKPQNNT